MDIYEIKCWLQNEVTSFLVAAIRKINQHKDNGLYYKLHNLDEEYNTRPKE